ncbi:MAG: hypothetical protein KDD84_16040, partial [Caldilineaceae bacterium]|nr:hypothetical protein [Caldilineaceae bacterium]
MANSPVPAPEQPAKLPSQLMSVADVDAMLSRPTAPALAALQNVKGDLVILGVSGKMGPTLARMAVRGFEQLGLPRRVYGVARFSQPHLRQELEDVGVRTIVCDLLDRAAWAKLPDSQDVIFMAGQKFGTTGN